MRSFWTSDVSNHAESIRYDVAQAAIIEEFTEAGIGKFTYNPEAGVFSPPLLISAITSIVNNYNSY